MTDTNDKKKRPERRVGQRQTILAGREEGRREEAGESRR
jgi:hypothetical protein